MPPEDRNRSHDEAVVELLKADPALADEYLAAAQEETEEPGGPVALSAALRHIAEAQEVPNAETRAAMEESRTIMASRRARFASAEALFASLEQGRDD
jgi:hypothetical protein